VGLLEAGLDGLVDVLPRHRRLLGDGDGQEEAAVVLRRGPGVIFALTGNRRYIVTVDDAESLARTVHERIGV